jgi:hypothetical protein
LNVIEEFGAELLIVAGEVTVDIELVLVEV